MASLITKDDFYRFWNEKVGNFKCEICSSENFVLLNDPDSETTGLAVQQATGQMQAIRLCATSCTNCGNTKTFLELVIAEWVKDNPK